MINLRNDFEKVEILSDAFQSTFAVLNETTLVNMFYENEQPLITFLIKKQFGDDINVDYKRITKDSDGYDVWQIHLKKELGE